MSHKLERNHLGDPPGSLPVAVGPPRRAWADPHDLRDPGLTILYHPRLERIGERASLSGLQAGDTLPLSREEPAFYPPDRSVDGQPLADRQLGHSPLRLGVTSDGGVELDGRSIRMTVVADGELVGDRRIFGRDRLERGVVLLLADRIVLLLHLLEPASPPELPNLGMVGECPGLIRVRQGIQKVADLDVSVLVRGETGTGKELVARAIHEQSSRSSGPFVALNMGALPANLAASELFGSTRGAFTGAEQARDGLFERANGGTLFLDEVGEALPEVQVLLLRALETGKIRRVGGRETRPVDVRVISATDRVLEVVDTEQGPSAFRQPFRQPLLHRLSGFVLHLPPLRSRLEDFGRLLVHFLREEMAAVEADERLAGAEPWLPPTLAARLAGYPWPGNVRQLKNVVSQLVIAYRDTDQVPRHGVLDDLLVTPASLSPPSQPSPLSPTSQPVPTVPTAPASAPARRRPADLSDDELVTVLRAHRWQFQPAADALGMPRSSLYDRVARTPRIRRASQLSAEEIEESRLRCRHNVEAMADELEVSARALRRRIGQLGL